MTERKTEFIIIRVTKSFKDRLKKKAKLIGYGFSDFIRQILDEADK